ncbi:hypothetical protein DM860_014900 [Cuscuta australis]|uniref:Uncharacterized protein n=1 Tax=Cuscuta australis TaxID=267555 RepID=A0A328E6I5_9ASTE|nr:hypothetical protein DM860_014900 [Cuscuta australis]
MEHETTIHATARKSLVGTFEKRINEGLSLWIFFLLWEMKEIYSERVEKSEDDCDYVRNIRRLDVTLFGEYVDMLRSRCFKAKSIESLKDSNKVSI